MVGRSCCSAPIIARLKESAKQQLCPTPNSGFVPFVCFCQKSFVPPIGLLVINPIPRPSVITPFFPGTAS